MRRYRGWHTTQKKMYSPDEMSNDQLTLMPDGSGFWNIDSHSTRLSQRITAMIPLEATGLFDKNGVEIFEGDIVDFKKGEYYHYGATGGTVEYQDGGFYPFADAEDNMPYPKPQECEIVGNIYENPPKEVKV